MMMIIIMILIIKMMIIIIITIAYWCNKAMPVSLSHDNNSSDNKS